MEEKQEVVLLDLESQPVKKEIEEAAQEMAKKHIEQAEKEINNKVEGKLIEGKKITEGSRLEIGKDTYKIIRVRDDGKVVMREEN